jgi:CHAD domain-containing protein
LCLTPASRKYKSVSELVATSGALALQVLRQQATNFAEHAPQVSKTSDPEHVHQTRVATRRLRAALHVFRDLLPPDLDTLDDELRWIAQLLGQVRDLDVQLQRLQANAAELGATQDVAPFSGWLEQRRDRALDALASAFQSVRFVALTERFQQLNQLQPDAACDPPLTEDAPGRLRAAERRLRKVADTLDVDSAASVFHKARIRAKRFRYTTEFFETVYGKPATRLIARATELQDLLGEHQDSVVSIQRVHEAVHMSGSAWTAETSLALGRLIQYEVQRQCELRGQFKPTYRAVQDAWRRLRRAL